jgi:hypothetical protein
MKSRKIALNCRPKARWWVDIQAFFTAEIRLAGSQRRPCVTVWDVLLCNVPVLTSIPDLTCASGNLRFLGLLLEVVSLSAYIVLLFACCRWSWIRAARVLVLGSFILWLGSVDCSGTFAAEPPAELTSAARDYRIEIYGAFRMNRAEYDARRKQGETLLAEWQTRGAKPEEAAMLVRWFDEARRAASRQQALPAAPNWNGPVEEAIPAPAPLPRLAPRPASPQPMLRALPVLRVRAPRQVQVTSISADIVRPSESQRTFALLAALPNTSSLALVLAFPNAAHQRTIDAQSLVKQDTHAQSNISAGSIDSPVPKTDVSSNEPVRPGNNMTEAAELNTAELRARLRGYDKAWRALQVDLYSDEAMSLERANALVTIMNDLVQARRDLVLYQAIAPLELREEIRGLAALDELQAQLRKLFDTARASVAADRTLTPPQRAALDRAWVRLLELK